MKTAASQSVWSGIGFIALLIAATSLVSAAIIAVAIGIYEVATW